MSGLSIFMRRLQKLDAYPKLKEDYREKTISGAAISVIAGIFMMVLFTSEFSSYLDLDTQHELVVDTGSNSTPKIITSFLYFNRIDQDGEAIYAST
jgi:hypothetical protein